MALEIEGIPTGNVYVDDSFDITVHDTNSNSPGFDTVSVSWTYDRNKIYIWGEPVHHNYVYHIVAVKAGTTVLTANYNGNSKSFTVNIKTPNVVTFNANGGSVSTSTMTARGSVTLPTPTHDDNHIFMGWFTATSFGDKIGNGGDTVPVDSDFTAYAQWLFLKYKPFERNQRYIDAQIKHENKKPEGIMVHSTGANNPNLKRYVGPNDGLLGENDSKNYWNVYHPNCPDDIKNPNSKKMLPHTFEKDKNGNCVICGGIRACVHAFIGKLADGTIAVYQTLPWNYMGWHSGSYIDENGTVHQNTNANNNGYIGFEICEDGSYVSNKDAYEAYVKAAFYEAVKLCAYLCKEHDIATSKVISHYEGNKARIASAHGDPDHWFTQYGLTMDYFRTCVDKIRG